MKKDTIAAISTGMTNSGIGIVRISGEEAFAIIDRIYKGKEQLSQAESHTIHYGFIKDREETIDEVLVSVMRAPRTFTGEDTVEINCHGGTFVVRKVLETVIKNGARPAEPGEFTKRAFLNGKMDLSQAEAVGNAQCFLKEDFEQNGAVYVATEDGSIGTKGNVMDAVAANGLEADIIYACGIRMRQKSYMI